jgi:Pyruvate/2-oxoacid:ferredoxin oxidoreductase gamma subunit
VCTFFIANNIYDFDFVLIVDPQTITTVASRTDTTVAYSTDTTSEGMYIFNQEWGKISEKSRSNLIFESE